MAKQVIKLGLEFDTKSAIASYRDLVSELSKGGADPKAIKQFTAAIEKAETELAQLAAEGSTGFTDSKGIEQYQKKVLKTVTSMQQLALRMQEFSKSGDNFPTSEVKKLKAEIEKLKKEITDAQKAAKEGLIKSLTTNGGFSKKDAEIIAETVKTEEQLIAKLEEEKKLRDEIRKAAQPAAEKATNAIKDKAIARATSGSQVVMDSVGMKGRKGVKAIREAVATSLQEGIKEGWNAEDIKKNALDAMKQAGISEKLAKEFEASFDLKAIEKELKRVNDDIAKNSAVKKYNEANKSYNQVASGSTENYSQFIAKSKEAAQAQQDLATAENQVSQAAINSAAAQKKNANSAEQEAIKAEQAASSFMQMSNAQKDNLKSTEQLEGGFNKLADRLKYMFGFTAMFNKLRQVIRSTFNDIQNLDKAYASIAYVTNETVADLWSTYGEYASMAEKLGQSTADVVKASAIYRQQGLDTAEALELTTDTMKLATIAGNDYSTATQEMTAALRGFKMEMDEGGHVSDVYSELAAHAAASVDDIAQAMSRTASIANSAGMSFENTSAFLTQMIETTQESAENIGTSMKTIIARFTELKENVAGTADSEFDDLSFNKVDEALKTVGVALKDTTGQFRNLDDVFLELSEKWDSLDRNTQRYIATVAAGSRQQSRFIALMDNYDRTVELINTAADSEGKAEEQFAKAADTIDFKLNAIKTKWEEFKLSIMDSSFVKGLLDAVDSLVDRIKNINMPWAAMISPIAIIAAKSFALNFITTIKHSATALSTVGKTIVSAITKNKPKIKLELEKKQLQKDLKEVENKIEQLKTSKKNTMSVQIEIKGNLDENKKKFDELTQEMYKLEEAEEQDLAKINEIRKERDALSKTIENNTTEYNKNAEALKNLDNDIQTATNQQNDLQQGLIKNTKATAKAQLSSEAFSGAIQSATLALTGYVSGIMSGGEALQSFGMTLGAVAGKLVLSATSSVINAHAMAAANGEAAVSFGTLAAAEWAALWPLLLIVGAAAGIAFLAGSLLKSAEAEREAASAAIQHKEALEQVQEAKNALSETNEELKELKEEDKILKKIKTDYEELSKKKIKTDEEQQQYNDLVEEIKEKFPEIISYENEITGEIQISNQLLQDKLDMLDEEIKKTKELKIAQEARVTNAQNKADIYGTITTVNSVMGTSIGANQGNLISDLGKMANGEKIRNTPDSESGSLTSTDWAFQINEFTNSLFSKGVITETEYDNLRQDWEKQVELFNNIVTGDMAKAVEGFSKKSADNIKEMSKKIQEASESLVQFKNYLEVTSDVVANLYGDEAQWSQNIRSIVGAGKLDAAIIEVPELDIDWTKAESKDGFKEVADSMKNQLEQSMREAGISEDDIKKLNNINLSEYEHVFDEVAIGSYGRDDYDDIDQKSLDFLEKKFGIKSEDDYNKFFGKDGQDDWVYGKKLLEEYYAELTKIALESKGVYDVSEDILKDAGALQDVSQMTPDEINEHWINLQNNISNLKPEQIEEINKLINVTGEAALETQKNVQSIFGADAASKTYEIQSALEKFYKDTLNATKDTNMAEEYVNSIYQILEKNKIPEEQWSSWFNIDFSKITNQEEFDKFKEEQIKQFKEAGYDDAEALFEEVKDYAEKYGILHISIETDADYDKFMDSLDTAQEKVQSLGDSIVNVTKDMKENGEVSYSTFNKLKSVIQELGLNVYDYMNINSNGKITANEANLKKLYEDQIKAKKEKIDQALQEEQLQYKQLELQKTQLELQLEDIDTADEIVLANNNINESLIPVVNNWKSIVKAMAAAGQAKFNENDFDVSSSFTLKVNNSNREAIKKEIQTQLDIIDGKMQQTQKTINKLIEDGKHVEEETQAQYRDWQHQMQEAITVTDNLVKKQEDLVKAQKDVADKQKKLNEAIQEYNDLIYGSKNRKSSLDLLYNYKEAISAFSDELTRAKELFEDSSSFDEANKNLDRYLAAAHNSMAEYAAQNEVLKIGLEKRKNNLLNGGTSYEGVNVRFGDYVKIDERTGLAAIDQRLLQEARFADKWKDQLESFVDDYNKYSQELLKNEDAMRKMEKEIQQMRMDATKKWADFEKDIAETLKNEYQEEVNQLKEKYESMKDADDDYLNALQEAIDKQRKLRDKEKKWDDLAKKEKKLSLMNRDTSGANQIDRLKMQQEIEQDRESLLDESIDEVIENMGKIYESQQELRDSEIELKEALLDDALYWNLTAQNVSESFTSVDEFLAWSVEHHKEYLEMTDAQKQEFLDQEQQKFDEAIQASAILAKEQISEVTESIQINSEEINRIVETTGEAYINETQRVMNETEDAMRREIQTAIDKINDAKTALDEANQKLLEASQNINQIAEQLANLQIPGYTAPQTFEPDTQSPQPGESGYLGTATGGNVLEETGASQAVIASRFPQAFNALQKYGYHVYTGQENEEMNKFFANLGYQIWEWPGKQTWGISDTSSGSKMAQEQAPYKQIAPVQKFYASGGLVNYTGPAWVDGTPNKPEAFLSAEDTERIGNAAKLLSNIPMLSPTANTNSNNSFGDTNIEINLNIDHISSDVDVDEMLERVKQEIVEVARPIGTNVILQQQV